MAIFVIEVELVLSGLSLRSLPLASVRCGTFSCVLPVICVVRRGRGRDLQSRVVQPPQCQTNTLNYIRLSLLFFPSRPS